MKPAKVLIISSGLEIIGWAGMEVTDGRKKETI